MSTKKYTVIIPVHVLDEEVDRLLTRAINSIPRDMCEVIIATSNELSQTLSEQTGIETVACENTDFCSLVNAAVATVKTKYFSILEFDDFYLQSKLPGEEEKQVSILFNNIEAAISSNPSATNFLSLTDIVSYKNDRFIQYANEAAWVASLYQDERVDGKGDVFEMGFINGNKLDTVYNYIFTGAIFDTEAFKAIGGLKTNIKLTFWYEYLLRANRNGQKFFVIPRVGYVHYVDRPGALFSNYQNEIDSAEEQFWMDTARIESKYNEQRDVKYVKE